MGPRWLLTNRACRYQGTATSGTTFAETRVPLTTRCAGSWYVANRGSGTRSLGYRLSRNALLSSADRKAPGER